MNDLQPAVSELWLKRWKAGMAGMKWPEATPSGKN